MARRRFFVPRIHNRRAELNGEDALHLTRVLRVERGQHLEISDNQAAYLAEVTEARKDRVLFSIVEPVAPNPLPVRITLLAALIKFDRFEWILEKGVELGVERFVPIIAERSERGLDRAAEKRETRWRRILLEASQQCRRDHLPELDSPLRVAEALRLEGEHRLLLEETGGRPLLNAVAGSRAARDRVLLLAGPEGGWTEGERRLAAGSAWIAVSLGPLILRAETACIAATALIAGAWSAAAAPES